MKIKKELELLEPTDKRHYRMMLSIEGDFTETELDRLINGITTLINTDICDKDKESVGNE